MSHNIAALYTHIRDLPERDPAWEELRQAEAAALPTCVNHPGRATVGGFGDEFYCHECVGAEIAKRRMYMKSQSLIVGGVEALR